LFGHRIIGGYLFGKTNSQDYTTGGDIIGPAAYFKENMLLFESWWYIRNKIRHLKMKCFYKGGIVTNLCVLHLEKQIFKHNSFTLSTQGLILESTI
jgi:hypothetical protein